MSWEFQNFFSQWKSKQCRCFIAVIFALTVVNFLAVKSKFGLNLQDFSYIIAPVKGANQTSISYFSVSKSINQTIEQLTDNQARNQPCPPGIIIIRPPDGGLGNRLFEYATLFATAKRFGLTPYYPKEQLYKSTLPSVFCNLSIKELSCNTTLSAVKFTDLGSAGCCMFNSRLTDLKTSQSYYLHGYSISWKHFDFMRKDVQNELSLCPDLENFGNHYIEEAIDALNYKRNRVEAVGIHIRRSDFVNNSHGYIASDKAFIVEAVKYVEARIFPGRIPVYFICADQLNWAKSELSGIAKHLVFVEGKDAKHDFAVLKSVEILILSAGASTFAFWTAYLNQNARFVVYPYPFVVNGSGLGKQTEPADVMLPGWAALGSWDNHLVRLKLTTMTSITTTTAAITTTTATTTTVAAKAASVTKQEITAAIRLSSTSPITFKTMNPITKPKTTEKPKL